MRFSQNDLHFSVEMVADELPPYSLINLIFYNWFDPIITQIRIQKGLDFKTPNQMAEDFYRLAV